MCVCERDRQTDRDRDRKTDRDRVRERTKPLFVDSG